MADELTTLRAEAEALGVHVDGRWGAERLRAEIAAAQPEPEPEPEPELTAVEVLDRLDEVLDAANAPAEAPAPVVRAGGHVDYGDGRGWVVEELEPWR